MQSEANSILQVAQAVGGVATGAEQGAANGGRWTVSPTGGRVDEDGAGTERGWKQPRSWPISMQNAWCGRRAHARRMVPCLRRRGPSPTQDYNLLGLRDLRRQISSWLASSFKSRGMKQRCDSLANYSQGSALTLARLFVSALQWFELCCVTLPEESRFLNRWVRMADGEKYHKR